jgi:hypothetical protein
MNKAFSFTHSFQINLIKGLLSMRKACKISLLLIFLFSLSFVPVSVFEIDKEGYVSFIYDGDTFELTTGAHAWILMTTSVRIHTEG